MSDNPPARPFAVSSDATGQSLQNMTDDPPFAAERQLMPSIHPMMNESPRKKELFVDRDDALPLSPDSHPHMRDWHPIAGPSSSSQQLPPFAVHFGGYQATENTEQSPNSRTLGHAASSSSQSTPSSSKRKRERSPPPYYLPPFNVPNSQQLRQTDSDNEIEQLLFGDSQVLSGSSSSKGKGKQRERSPEPDSVIIIPDSPEAPSHPPSTNKISAASTPSKPQPEPLSEFTCPICFSPPTNATLTPCGHICCGECLFTAVKTTMQRASLSAVPDAGVARCPVCRANIPGWDGKGGGVIGLKPRAIFSL